MRRARCETIAEAGSVAYPLKPHEQRIIGGYRVVERLGSGATSDVLLAAEEGDGPLRKRVVLKLLSVRVEDASAVTPFGREVDAFRSLSHPALVGLKKALVLEDGEVALVLEHVPGLSLEQFLERRGSSKRLPDGVVLYIMERVFAALAAAHAHRPTPVVHGEIRASNLLLGWDGTIKLTDFGITKVLGGSSAAMQLPRSRFSYVSPEEAQGKPPTPASDVYAAGVILWELLSGHAPPNRHADNQQEMARALAEPNLLPIDKLRPDLPVAIRQLVNRLLIVDPRSRTLSAEEVVAGLMTRLPLERGRDKLATILAPLRPYDSKPPTASALLASAVTDHEAMPPQGQAAVFRSLGGASGAIARRRPRSASRPDSPHDSSQTRDASEPSLPSAPSVVEPPQGSGASMVAVMNATNDSGIVHSAPSSPTDVSNIEETASTAEASAIEALAPRATDARGRSKHRAPAARVPAWAWGLLVAVPLAILLARRNQTPPRALDEPPRPKPSAVLAFEPSHDPAASSLAASATLAPSGPRLVPTSASAPSSSASTTSVASASMQAASATSASAALASGSAPIAAPSVSASASLGSDSSLPDTGIIRTGRSANDRRVFVDGRVVGQGADTFTVKCGTRRVRVGSSGREQRVDVPCGGELALE